MMKLLKKSQKDYRKKIKKGSVLIMDRKEWLIGELAKAKAIKDYNAIEDLATELYEVYGWCGEPYYTH